MDFIQDYLTVLPKLLPPSLASPLLTLLTTMFGIFHTLQTHLTPLLIRLTTQPDVASILALLAIFFISLKILDMAYRAVMFWVRLVLRLAVWGSLVMVGLWVWQRGVEGFFEDVQGLVEFWMGEYNRYSGEVKRWQQYEEDQIRYKSRKTGRQWK